MDTVLNNLPYISPTPGELPLIGYGPTRHHVIPTVDDFLQFADCGFNVAMYPGPHHPEDVRGIMMATMQNALEAGVKVLVFDEALMAQSAINLEITEWMVKTFRSWENLVGWNINDEPDIYSIWPPKATDEPLKLKTAYERIAALDPNHMTYFNLAAATGEDWTGTMTYPEYLECIQRTIAPPVWSFDLYSIIGNFPPKVSTVNLYVRPEWYEYLEYFRRISARTERPFWSYCLSVEHFSINKYQWYYPLVETSYLRFYAFSALAYGAKGLVFWTYCQPVNGAYIYGESPIDRAGNKTRVWENVKIVLNEIKILQDVFLQNNAIAINHIDLENQIFPKPIIRLSSTNGGVLVTFLGKSHIQDNPVMPEEYEWIFIVNKNPFARQKIRINYFDSLLEVTDGKPINYYNPNILSDASLWNKMKEGMKKEYILEAGGYMIIKKPDGQFE